MNNIFKSALSKIISLFKRRETMKNLAIFDFDHTVVDDNSDTAVMKLLDKSKFPPELRELHKAEGWTSFMQGVFEVLHKNHITEPQITQLIRNLPAVKGIKNLIVELSDNMNYDVIIISDSNTLFIEQWLEANELKQKVLKVFSNPAEFDHEGLLKIQMYHVQDECKLSTRNMCKGMIMQDFIKCQKELGVVYGKVIYVGDGHNDLCPILRLDELHVACCRNKYKCVELIRKIQSGQSIEGADTSKYSLKADVCVWESGNDILDFIKNKNPDE